MFFESFHSMEEDEFRISLGEGIDFPLHLHRAFEFFVQKEGETRVCIDEKMYNLRAGEAVLIFPFQIHSYTCKVVGKFEILFFSPDIVMTFYNHMKNLVPVDNKIQMFSMPEPCADNIYLKKAYAYHVCGMFAQNREYEKVSKGGHAVLAQLLLYANENFRTKCMLRDICTEIGYDYVYISKFFKRAVGIPFRRYVNLLRIRESQYLLKSSSQGMIEIAYESGFSSLRDFDRQFVAIVGCTPTEYRKNHLSQK